MDNIFADKSFAECLEIATNWCKDNYTYLFIPMFLALILMYRKYFLFMFVNMESDNDACNKEYHSMIEDLKVIRTLPEHLEMFNRFTQFKITYEPTKYQINNLDKLINKAAECSFKYI